MREIDYRQADSPSEAVQLASEHGDRAMFIAGGQSLNNMLKQRLLPAGQTVIDIRNLDGLAYVEQNGDRIDIGAVTTHTELAESKVLETHLPALPEMVAQVGDVQVRNMGTIGGDLAQADPRADYPVLASAVDATVSVQGPSEARTIDIDDFFTGYFETDLAVDELLVEVTVPALRDDEAAGFSKYAKQKGDFPLVNAAAWMTTEDGIITDARVRVGCISDRPVPVDAAEDYLVDAAIADVDPAVAGERTRDDIDPDPDEDIDEAYKRDLGKALVTNAVTDCVERVEA